MGLGANVAEKLFFNVFRKRLSPDFSLLAHPGRIELHKCKTRKNNLRVLRSSARLCLGGDG
jgi:hypothetical protein